MNVKEVLLSLESLRWYLKGLWGWLGLVDDGSKIQQWLDSWCSSWTRKELRSKTDYEEFTIVVQNYTWDQEKWLLSIIFQVVGESWSGTSGEKNAIERLKKISHLQSMIEKDLWSAVVFWQIGKAANLGDIQPIAVLREDHIIGRTECQCN